MNERISNLIRHPLTIPISIGVASFGTGVVTGFVLARKTGKKAELYEIPQAGLHLTEEDLDLLRPDEDDEEEELVSKGLVVDDEPEDDGSNEELAKEWLESTGLVKVVEVDGEQFEAEDEDHLKVVGAPAEVTPVRRNAFADNGDDWDYEKELASRTTDRPYVLHRDEFYAEEKGYSQITITYYAGDNILVDEDEHPIYNHGHVVGDLKFGHGSGDKNVLYVRNDHLKAEYEILHDSGLYSVEVLGLEIEDNQRVRDLRHSHQPGKFRAE